MVDGDKHTVLVPDLKPNTKYVFTVRAVYTDALGESAAVKGKTSEYLFCRHPRMSLVHVGTGGELPKNHRCKEGGMKG